MKKFIKSFFIFLTIVIIINLIIIISYIGIKIFNEDLLVDVFEPIFDDDIIEISKDTTNSIIDNPINNINSSENINIDSSENINDYYYEQLDEYAKIIYKKIDENKENMKSGEYTIDFEKTFNKLLNTSEGEEKINIAYQSSLDAYMLDNPDIFYLDVTKIYLLINSRSILGKTTYLVTIGPEDGKKYYSDGFNSKEDIENAINNCENVANQILQYSSNDNKYEEIKNIHNLIIDNMEYDESLSNSNIRNIYGALIERKIVCEGYAKVYKYLLDKINVENIIVVGYGINSSGRQEEHAWNYLKLNDNWYAVDVTWDDPIIIGGGRLTNSNRYRYFLKGSDDFNTSHTPTGKASENGIVFTYPRIK